MTPQGIKQIHEELLKLKSQEVISVDDKLRIQKLQQTLDNILNGEFDYEILHYQSHPKLSAPLSN